MATDDAPESDLENVRESAEFVSGTAFRLLRINFIIVGIFLTVAGYLSNINGAVKQSIATSNYMVASIILLLMSLIAGFFAYESAGRLAAIHMFDNPEEEYGKHFNTERPVFNVRYATFLSLCSVGAFAIAILEGITPGGFNIQYVGQLGFTLLVITVIPLHYPRPGEAYLFTILHQFRVYSHKYNVYEHRDLSGTQPFPEMETPHRVDPEANTSSNVPRL